MTKVFAPAKVNLTLHITDQRNDGYHLLDSLVMFADVGDMLTISETADLKLTVTGPEAVGLSNDDNSILAAARSLNAVSGAAITLHKTLPVASGIGGGSTDAAAALRGLSSETSFDPADLSRSQTNKLISMALPLGADVPVCLFRTTARMRGIGEELDFLPDLPAVNAVLANPRVPVSTPAVFKAITQKANPAMPDVPQSFADVGTFIDWLSAQRNDMQDAAVALAPQIADALDALEKTKGCKLARMSGSGATCFGLYTSAHDAAKAADALTKTHPDWWVAPCVLGGKGKSAGNPA